MSVVVTHRGRTWKLGRRPFTVHKVSEGHLLAARAKIEGFPDPVPVDWISAGEAQCGGNFGEMGNDRLGDCTAAAKGHIVQSLSANTGVMVTPTDDTILSFYEKTSGYNPADPSTDQGAIMVDTEEAFVGGFPGLPGPDDFIPVNYADLRSVRIAIERYGWLDIGLALPRTIEGQDGVWSDDLTAGADAAAGSLGGHDVTLEAWGDGYFDCITWGGRKRMAVEFFQAYCVEAYTGAHKLWAARLPGGVSPRGDSMDALRLKLPSIGGSA